MASRDMQATFTRVLHLGLSVFGYLRAFGELHFSSFLLAGNLSMASPMAVEHLEEIVPLPLLQRLVCFLIFFREPMENCSLCPCATTAGGGALFPFRRSEWRCRAAG